MVLAGRGYGKTRTGAEWVREQVKRGVMRIGLIAPTAADARDVMVEGESGLEAICCEDDQTYAGEHLGVPVYQSSKRRVIWANGAVGMLYSAEKPGRLRGPQHEKLWCFVAGTMVSTPRGERPIEDIGPGDLVLTRAGPCRVIVNSIRNAPVGRVTFDNGKELVGTPDHPIYTKSGWTRLDQLTNKDRVCAINASNGTAKNGTGTPGDITREPIRPRNQRQFGSIGQFGNIIKGLSRLGLRFTTGTKIKATAILRTLSASRKGDIQAYIGNDPLYLKSIGPTNRPSPSSAGTAARRYGESVLTLMSGVRPATVDGPTPSGHAGLWSVENAGTNSKPEVETTVASVASIWRPEAGQDVYCLKVSGTPEYFANGILVHNCDEMAAWERMKDTYDMAMFGLRLGDDPQIMITTTPKPRMLLREISQHLTTVVTGGSTYDNRANLPKVFFDDIVSKYEGTALGRQEIHAQMLDEAEGALWQRGWFDRGRVMRKQMPELRRSAVAIDPAASNTEKSDETGIVFGGVGTDERGYVVEDLSGRYSPDGWARKAIDCYFRNRANFIIAERNNGGEMVEATIKLTAVAMKAEKLIPTANVPVVTVWASQGKYARAEPVSGLYEQGRISHVNHGKLDPGDLGPDQVAAQFDLTELEDQCCTWEPNGKFRSPDRLDAVTWLWTELMVEPAPTLTAAPISLDSPSEWQE